MTETKSTCPYCGVGCGVIIEAQAGQITGVRGDPDHPANFGRLCTKGSTLHLTAAAPLARHTRLLQPMLRAQRGEAPAAITWDKALDQAAGTFARVIGRHGPDAVGFYVSGQLLTEDYYAFNKLAKGLVGTNNIDTNSRLCMSSAVAGYKRTLGADAPPCSYEDIDHAGCIVIAGSNTAWAHPILFRRIEEARARRPGMKIIVCDPRRTDTAGIADLFLPLQPGTDVLLFNGLLHLMLWEGWTRPGWIARHTTGFEALKAAVRDCTPDVVAQACGLSKDDLLTAARWFATGGSDDIARPGGTLSLYCQGLNQSSSGTDKNVALINLHLATAQIGRAGAGPFSLTGQPNAMGGREVGGLANLLSAHRDLSNAQHRAEVAALWGVPSVPEKPGKTAVEMFQAAADGEIKALWIACTNPAQSMPDQATVRRALERADFVVVQEAFAGTATCAYADLLLPATTWGEKDGTVTNSERRISRVRPAVPAPGDARHDWSIAVDFARRLEPLLPPRISLPLPLGEGRAEGRPAPEPPPSHPSPEERRRKTLFADDTAQSLWNEHRASTAGRDLDITGLSYALLEQGPRQWPFPAGASEGRTRLYEDGVFPTGDGKARFVPVTYRPVAEPRDARYPFALTTGRLRDQWHGMSRTGLLGRLFGHVPEPVVQLHPQDMVRRQLRDGDLVHVTSRRGSILVPLQGSTEVATGQAFMAMHWGGDVLGGSSSTGHPLAGVNALTTSASCPHSRQPELKHAAVKVLKAELPWSLLAMAWLPDDAAPRAREQLRALMPLFPFATCVPFGRERTGLLFRAAAHEVPPPQLLVQVEAALQLDGPQVLRYVDARSGQRRAAMLAREGTDLHLTGFLLGGDTRAEAWIRTLLQDGLPAQAYGRLLLAPGAKAPVALAARGRQVCTCFDVREPAIQATLQVCRGSDEQRLTALQTGLKCGTNCGSCIPELRRLVQATPALRQAA